METHLETIFSPAEQKALELRDLSKTVCVVFDILRATTTMATALANGAAGIYPVGEIEEAVALRRNDPEIMLAGERHGLRIQGRDASGMDFDFGNSPREFTRDKVQGRRIAITTTNGTRALRSVAAAKTVLIGSFRNLKGTAAWILGHKPENLLLVCSGTGAEASYEDALGAGALADEIWELYGTGKVADSAHMARNLYLGCDGDLRGAMKFARNGRRLSAIPDLAADVPICLERDIFDFAAGLQNGVIQKL
jgi:2-phosphosulfolactate phosphatase